MTYRVTAEDGSFEDYVATATVAAIDAKDILSFRIPGQSGSVISGTDITVTVPYGTDKTSLTPAIIHTGVSISPETGTAQNFSSPVAYTVTDGAGSTKVYTVTVKIWVKTFGGTSPDLGKSSCTDSSGNVYVTGCFSGTVDFGDGTVTSSGASDVFILKYNANGDLQWVKTFGGLSGVTYSDQGFSIYTDPSGNVYITGEVYGSVDFGGGASSGVYDAFIVKYSSDGAYQWGRRFGNNYYGSTIKSLCTDKSGSVYITGKFVNTVDFGGGQVTSLGGYSDIFLVKYSSSGAYEWSKNFGDSYIDAGNSVCTDSAGNVYITGGFGGTVDFGGGNLATGDTANSNVFIAKYTANGVYEWAKKFGSGEGQGYSVCIDASDNIYITGRFKGTVDFGGGSVVSKGVLDGFIAKYSSSGVYQWSKGVGGTQDDISHSICTDLSGNLYITGYFTGSADFGGGTITGNGNADVFITKYTTDGVYQWMKHFGGTSIDIGYSICTGINGSIFASGYYSNTVNFGDGNVTSNGTYDVFLVNVLNE